VDMISHNFLLSFNIGHFFWSMWLVDWQVTDLRSSLFYMSVHFLLIVCGVGVTAGFCTLPWLWACPVKCFGRGEASRSLTKHFCIVSLSFAFSVKTCLGQPAGAWAPWAKAESTWLSQVRPQYVREPSRGRRTLCLPAVDHRLGNELCWAQLGSAEPDSWPIQPWTQTNVYCAPLRFLGLWFGAPLEQYNW
jgi:hypothetical protein